MKQSRLTLYSRILLCLYIGAVLFLCFAKLPQDQNVPKIFLGIPLDKAAHFLMFLPLVPLMMASFIKDGDRLSRAVAVMAIAFVCGILLAGTTEYIQGLTSYRSRDPFDFAADCSGILAGTIACLTIVTFSKHISK